LSIREIGLIQVGTTQRKVINEFGIGRIVDSLPTNDDVVIGAIDLCVPRSKSFVESRRNKLGKDTLELGATVERDVTPVWKFVEQWR
jgi:hypothetical protein